MIKYIKVPESAEELFKYIEKKASDNGYGLYQFIERAGISKTLLSRLRNGQGEFKLSTWLETKEKCQKVTHAKRS